MPISTIPTGILPATQYVNANAFLRFDVLKLILVKRASGEFRILTQLTVHKGHIEMRIEKSTKE